MYDLFLAMGSDLSLSATGDIALVKGAEATQQRILRRLLTNGGDYIWHLEFGAGLASFVGQTVSVSRINAAIRGQIFKEKTVARTPEPVIDVQIPSSGPTSTVFTQIQYTDASNRQTQLLSFSVSS